MTAKQHYHILGIMGHAMRGVALALKEQGNEVTGTDVGAYADPSDWLSKQGITWWHEADVVHLEGVTTLILGGGEPLDHPELVAAQDQGIAIQSYPEVVGELVKDARRIAVTGTHGKTTTTSLVAWLLESAGRKPDFLVGIKPNNFDSSVRLAGADIAVLEGDEYRSSRLDDQSKFMHYKPDIAIITSIEHDHPDMFPDLNAVKARFTELVKALPSTGHLYVWSGSTVATEVAVDAAAPISTYGHGAQWRAAKIAHNPEGLSFELHHHGTSLGRLSVALYGDHNVQNATAAAAVVLAEGVSFEELATGMKSFKGAARRFERVSAPGAKITVIDDYAHHPTEVAATLAAAKAHFDGRVVAVFRPHTYSRTQALLTEYQEAFKDADVVFIAPIEGAREQGAASNVSGADIAIGANAHYVEDRAELVRQVVAEAKPGDLILCMTVNGYENIAQELSEKTA